MRIVAGFPMLGASGVGLLGIMVQVLLRHSGAYLDRLLPFFCMCEARCHSISEATLVVCECVCALCVRQIMRT